MRGLVAAVLVAGAVPCHTVAVVKVMIRSWSGQQECKLSMSYSASCHLACVGCMCSLGCMRVLAACVGVHV